MELLVGFVVLILIGSWIFHMWRLTRRRADIWKGRGPWKGPEDGRLFTITTEIQENAERELLTYELPIRTLIENESVRLPARPLVLPDAGGGVEVVPDAGVGLRRLTTLQEFVFPLPDGLPVSDLPSSPEEASEVPGQVPEVSSSLSEPHQQGSISRTGVWQSGGPRGEGHGSR